jgi:hypothetical protein
MTYARIDTFDRWTAVCAARPLRSNVEVTMTARVVVLGGGFSGMATVRRLERVLRRRLTA